MMRELITIDDIEQFTSLCKSHGWVAIRICVDPDKIGTLEGLQLSCSKDGTNFDAMLLGTSAPVRSEEFGG